MKIRQSRLPMWVGAFQVQISNSMFYMNIVSMAMMIGTFWYTAGYQISAKYLPWMNIWLFIVVVVVIFIIVMISDYMLIMPTRVAFTNKQACKHDNPAMVEILNLTRKIDILTDDIKKIKAAVKAQD